MEGLTYDVAIETEETLDEGLLELRDHSSSAICDQCGKGFTNVYTLKAHKDQVHHGIKSFKCNICNTKFATKYKLHRHHLGVHSEKRDFHCTSCSHSFKTRDMLIKHQRTHFQGPFDCDICTERFKFKSGLDHHNKLKHTISAAQMAKSPREKSMLLYECSFCKKIYKTLRLLQRHEEDHRSDEKLFCPQPNCVKIFKNSKELARHEKLDHTEAVYFSCSYCLKQYKSKSNFEIHIASHENGNEMDSYEYVIEEATAEVAYETESLDEAEFADDLLKNIDEEMVSVVKIETERFVEVPLEIEDVKLETMVADGVEYCGEDDAEDFLIEHDSEMDFYETIIAEDLEPPPLDADDIITQDDDELQFSEIISEDEVTVLKAKVVKKPKPDNSQSVCEECGSTFQNISHLKRHIQRKHRKDCYNLECDKCGQKFLLNYDLKRHMTKHSSIRDFSCAICDQKFKTELSLKNHIKALHSMNDKQERVFNCNFCDRSYFHQRHLDYHMRKHTGDQRYACDLCVPGKSFYYSDAVKWHRIRHHGEPAPFNCPICNKKFIHEKSLQTHEMEHQGVTGSLAVECPVCKKFVSEKRHLKRHMRGHTAKEFQCKCGDSFKERHQLTKHSANCKIYQHGLLEVQDE